MIGIVSDSHDNLKAIDKAVEFLKRSNIELLIHAGDIVSPFAAVKFNEIGCRPIMVFGNNDGERKLLSEKVKEIHELAEFGYKGRSFAVYHGTIRPVTRALVKSELYDVVISGHTHKPEISNNGRTLYINPGELCGYLTGKKTLCLLNLEKMKAEIVEI